MYVLPKLVTFHDSNTTLRPLLVFCLIVWKPGYLWCADDQSLMRSLATLQGIRFLHYVLGHWISTVSSASQIPGFEREPIACCATIVDRNPITKAILFIEVYDHPIPRSARNEEGAPSILCPGESIRTLYMFAEAWHRKYTP